MTNRYGTASGTLNYEQDILSFVKNGQVKIHRQDISHLLPRKVHLVSTGQDEKAIPDTHEVLELDVDALVSSTGYSAKPTIAFSPSTLHSDLGLPTTNLTPEQQTFWSGLDSKADLDIGHKFPELIEGPPKPQSDAPSSSEEPRTKPINLGAASEASYTPWRLYRGIAPPGLTNTPQAADRSLVFIGMFSNIANTIRLEIQCLWGLAYLENKLPHLASPQDHDDDDDMRTRIFEETALFQRYTQHRAPYGHGRFYPDLVFDQLPYWDVLLNDLGLETRRKGGFLGFRELFEPYTQADYRGLVDEWLAKLETK